jgi:hypothetical protein
MTADYIFLALNTLYALQVRNIAAKAAQLVGFVDLKRVNTFNQFFQLIVPADLCLPYGENKSSEAEWGKQ